MSFIINNVDRREMRRSSLVRWDTSLEDVQEDSDTEGGEDEEGSEMEDTILDAEEEGKETVLLDKEVYEVSFLSMVILGFVQISHNFKHHIRCF